MTGARFKASPLTAAIGHDLFFSNCVGMGERLVGSIGVGADMRGHVGGLWAGPGVAGDVA
jgi:hypothetical protein